MQALEDVSLIGTVAEEVFVSLMTHEVIRVFCDCDLGRDHAYSGWDV
jgi:hypothetical protein